MLMNAFASFDVDDLKLVYTTLQAQLLEVEDLVESDFLAGLQDHLRKLATDAGVDTSDHAKWIAWLSEKGRSDKHLRLV